MHMFYVKFAPSRQHSLDDEFSCSQFYEQISQYDILYSICVIN